MHLGQVRATCYTQSMPQLTVIIPVYNEAEIILDVVNDWLHTLAQLPIDSFKITLYNDGSTDTTYDILNHHFTNHPHIHVVHKPNSGHGPTILQGYREALNDSEWIFQVDGDNEITAAYFPLLWAHREDYHFLIGYRINRESLWVRSLVTWLSYLTVSLCFRPGINDVNCPYRLFKASVFASVIMSIPYNTFAPNLLLSGIANKRADPIFQTPVHHHLRKTGTDSIPLRKLIRVSLLSFWQTLTFSLKH
jgi:dolichol-phosphate mannosyltransferase